MRVGKKDKKYMYTTIILTILIIILLGKWIILIGLVFSVKAYSIYQNNKGNLIAKVLSIPFFIVNKLCRGGYMLWSIYKVGLFPSHHFRKWFFKQSGVKMESNVVFHIGTQIRSPWKLSIGKGSVIGNHVTLDARSGLAIGENVNISSNVSIWTLQHDHRTPDFGCPDPNKRKLDVKVGNRVWLGCNVIVLPGVSIGEGAVCCGGCVVTKNVEPFTVVAGIPAKKVGDRPRNLTYEFNGQTCRLY